MRFKTTFPIVLNTVRQRSLRTTDPPHTCTYLIHNSIAGLPGKYASNGALPRRPLCILYAMKMLTSAYK